MKESPILFSGPMVKAILAGTKTQTRRVIKPQPHPECEYELGPFYRTIVDWYGMENPAETDEFGLSNENDCIRFPYGRPGDRLWVKETFVGPGELWNEGATAFYRADWKESPGNESKKCRWRPSIFMPRRLSRITLEILSVRPERLQDISLEDAKAGGRNR